jgi:hypothetical protein
MLSHGKRPHDILTYRENLLKHFAAVLLDGVEENMEQIVERRFSLEKTFHELF